MNDPPARTRKNAAQLTIRPPVRLAAVMGGWRPVPFQQACACWGKVLELATEQVSKMLLPGEWEFLASVMVGHERSIDPDHDNPASLLVQHIVQAMRYELGYEWLGNKPGAQAYELVGRIGGLDYFHTWAILWALQYRLEYQGVIKKHEEWWTLAHRQRNVKVKGEGP